MYHRVFHVEYGQIKKSRLCFDIIASNAGSIVRRKSPDHKLSGNVEEAISAFNTHIDIISDIYGPTACRRNQFLLVELGADSTYKIVAITNKSGNVVRLDQ